MTQVEERLKAYEATIRRLNAKLAAYKKRIEEPAVPHRKRTNYPRDAKRGEDRRVIMKCVGCGETGPMHAHEMCPKCYLVAYRNLMPNPKCPPVEPLGSLDSPMIRGDHNVS
jgi:ribosomal protein L32